jgi:hypothetical protein
VYRQKDESTIHPAVGLCLVLVAPAVAFRQDQWSENAIRAGPLQFSRQHAGQTWEASTGYTHTLVAVTVLGSGHDQIGRHYLKEFST